MKISICDVCYSKGKKLTPATMNSVMKHRGERLKLDICVDHKGAFKGAKTMAEAREIYYKILGYGAMVPAEKEAV